MPRINRVDVGGEIYHIINRANARVQIFDTADDYKLFENVLKEAKERTGIQILSYCIMPNHWHMVVSPIKDGDLSKFVAWLTMTHTQRWHASHKTIGSGHLYQGRYKSFLVQNDEYFLQLCRYVERNPLRAKLVKRAEEWSWSSLWRREKGTVEQKKLLSAWLIDAPADYLEWVSEKEGDETANEIRYCMNRGKPYGASEWVEKVLDTFKLGSTVAKRGRPIKGV